MPDKRGKAILVCGESELGYSRDETMIEALRRLDGWRTIDCRDTGNGWGSRLLARLDVNKLRHRIKKRMLFQRIRRHIASRSVDCILVMKNNPGLLFAIAPWAKEAKIPVLYDLWVSRILVAERDGGDREAAVAHEARIMAAADRGLSLTEPYRSFYIESLGCPAERIAVVPLAVTDDWLSTPETPSHSGETFIVGYWGSYLKQHGVELLLEAAHELRAQADMEFRFYGTARDYDARTILAQAGSNVRYFGHIRSREGLIGAIDACHAGTGHLCHIHDAHLTLPNKALEGMARGKAIIHVDDPLFYPQYGKAGDPSNAVFYYPGGTAALVRAILDLKSDAPRCRTIGKNAKNIVKQRHTVQAVQAALSGIMAGD